ncbi:ABC transporter permease [Streptomyces camelliae]|uniref:Transport permease protein n=1 Tax=Streptomyces camelliae TaxID=3004093 RepID=A0ABY7PG84_9ACTN|nr:ABC transporter permease [Streptomyces sp. HUAS 2-6]WBO69638.1 ABC transporter permease [Streptomyces sp. HUAS 2-6]
MAGTLQRNAGAAVTLRLFFVAGWRSHLALFRWLRPSAFLPTVLGVPLVQLVWFAHLGRYLGTRPVSYYVVGNALIGCSMAGLFAPSMSIQGERFSGTLSAVLATPAHRAVMFGGRIVPAVLFGALTSSVMLGFGMVVGWAAIPLAALPQLAAAVLVTALSCSAFGLIIGAVGLRTREATLVSNMVLYTMLLLCGVNVPVAALPGWLAVIGTAMPMTQGIEAARRALSGDGGVAALLGWELLKAAVFVLVGLLMLRVLERMSLAAAVLDDA